MDIRDLHIIDVDAHITEPPDLWTRRRTGAHSPTACRRSSTSTASRCGRSTACCSTTAASICSSVIRTVGEKVPGPALLRLRARRDPPGVVRHARPGSSARRAWASTRRSSIRTSPGFGAQKFGEVADPGAPPPVRHALQRRHGRDPGGVGRTAPPDGAHAVVGRRGVDRGSAPRRGQRPARRQHVQRPAGTRRARALAAGMGPVLGGVRRARACR